MEVGSSPLAAPGGPALLQQQKPSSQPDPGGCKPLARACAGLIRPATWPSSSSALASGRRSRGPSRAPQTLLHVRTQAEEPRGVERSRKEPHLRGMVCAGQTSGPLDRDFLYLLPTPAQRRAGSTPVVTARRQRQLPSSSLGHRAPALPATPSSTVTSGQQLLGFSSEGAPAWDSFPSHSKILLRPRATVSSEQPPQKLARTEAVPHRLARALPRQQQAPAAGPGPPSSSWLQPAAPLSLQGCKGSEAARMLLAQALPAIWSQVPLTRFTGSWFQF